MAVKYQIFVSSTFEDLKRERSIVVEQILNMGHIPIGMESFNAADDTQWIYIKRRIDESDYYVVIIAERYGEEDGDISYTRKEYEYAVQQGKPVTAFLLGEEGRKTWPGIKVDFEKKEKLKSFRDLCKTRVVKFWDNPDQLGTAVVLSLAELANTKPGVGWIKGDSVSPHVAMELATLSQENRVLKEELSRIKDVDIEEVKIPKETRWRLEELSNKHVCLRNRINKEETSTYFTMLDCFLKLQKSFAVGVSQYLIERYLITIIEISEIQLIAIDDFIAELAGSNIIVTVVEQSKSFDAVNIQKMWYLSEYGKEFLFHAKRWNDTSRQEVAVIAEEGDREGQIAHT